MTVWKYDPVAQEIVERDEYERRKALRKPPHDDIRAELPSMVERGRWVFADGRMIPAAEYYGQRGAGGGLTIMKDLEPYQAVTGRVVDGKVVRDVIGGRKQHRDHLRATSTIEIGNEKVKPPPRDRTTNDHASDIARAMQETGYWKP